MEITILQYKFDDEFPPLRIQCFPMGYVRGYTVLKQRDSDHLPIDIANCSSKHSRLQSVYI